MQEVVRTFIQEYNRLHKATILLTSHYMADVQALCERVMVINRGKLLYDGELADLVDRHAPYKRLKVWFEQAVDELDLQAATAGQAVCIEHNALYVELEVARTNISKVSAALLQAFPIVDLTIEEPSLESVISRAFAVGEAEVS
jgi:ABC-2 type transport system ATP-binding protein